MKLCLENAKNPSPSIGGNAINAKYAKQMNTKFNHILFFFFSSILRIRHHVKKNIRKSGTTRNTNKYDVRFKTSITV